MPKQEAWPENLSRLTATFWVRPDYAERQKLVTFNFGHKVDFGLTADGVPQFSADALDAKGKNFHALGAVWSPLAPHRWHRVVIDLRWEKTVVQNSPQIVRLDVRCTVNGESTPVLEASFDASDLSHGPHGSRGFGANFQGVSLGTASSDSFGAIASLSDFRLYSIWPTTPANEAEDLMLHWPLQRPDIPPASTSPQAHPVQENERVTVIDVSGRLRHGRLMESNTGGQEHADPYVAIAALGSSAPAVRQTPAQTPAPAAGPVFTPPSPEQVDAVVKAIVAARASGELPAELFPYVTAPRTEHAKARIKQELAGISDALVRARYREGYALSIVESSVSCCPRVEFVPVAGVARRPRLLVVLEARLSNFPGRCGGGRLVHTMSLFPGETTTVSIRTFRKTESEATRASSIFDSFNTTSAEDFERSLQQEQETNRQEDSSQSYYAKVQAEASWGWGNASIDGGGQWDMSTALSQLTKSVTNATSKHASTASSNREVRVESAERVVQTEEKTESIERQLKNLNVSRTLNFLFWQLNQEFVSLLHVVDVRVAYFDGTAESVREAPLDRLHELLKEVVKDGEIAKVRDVVLDQLRQLKDASGKPFDGQLFKLPAQGVNAWPASLPGAFSKYQSPEGGPEFVVEGVALAVNRHVLRTDNVYVDTFLGLGDALDDYSQKLQLESNRERELENDRAAAELDRRRLGTELARKGDPAGAAVFAQIEGATPRANSS